MGLQRYFDEFFKELSRIGQSFLHWWVLIVALTFLFTKGTSYRNGRLVYNGQVNWIFEITTSENGYKFCKRMRSYFVYEKETSDFIFDCHSLFFCGLNAPWAPNEMSIQAPFVSNGACLKDLAKQFQHKCFLSSFNL